MGTSTAELMFEDYPILCVRILGRVFNLGRVGGWRREQAGRQSRVPLEERLRVVPGLLSGELSVSEARASTWGDQPDGGELA